MHLDSINDYYCQEEVSARNWWAYESVLSSFGQSAQAEGLHQVDGTKSKLLDRKIESMDAVLDVARDKAWRTSVEDRALAAVQQIILRQLGPPTPGELKVDQPRLSHTLTPSPLSHTLTPSPGRVSEAPNLRTPRFIPPTATGTGSTRPTHECPHVLRSASSLSTTAKKYSTWHNKSWHNNNLRRAGRALG